MCGIKCQTAEALDELSGKCHEFGMKPDATAVSQRTGIKKKTPSKAAREIESTFKKLGLETYHDRSRFLRFVDESSEPQTPGYITYISGGSMISAQSF
jgi:hypothetical protein